MDVLALVVDFQRFAVVALAVADVARHVDVGQEVHLDLEHAVALAGFAAAALDVEREAAGAVAARARFGHAGEQFADRRQQPGIGRRVGARCAADRRLVDVDHLVEVVEAGDFAVRGRLRRRSVEMAGRRRVQRVVDQRRLARAGNAGDAGQQADRQIERDVLQVVAARADHAQLAGRVVRARLARHLDATAPGEVVAGHRVRIGGDFVGRAFGDDAAAVHAGAGADVDHVVGAADGVLVVLDDDHRVADVAQLAQGGEQAVVVALVQADRRLVEHVHDAGQAGADLRGQADALRLAARERFRRAVEREVVEADVDQELQAAGDFLEDLFGDLRLVAAELQRGEVVARAAERQTADLVQGQRAALVPHAHVARLLAQAGAVAARAGLVADQLGQLLAHGDRVGFLVTALEVDDDALEGVLAHRDLAALVDVAERQLFLAGTVKDDLPDAFGQFVPRRVDVEAVVRGERAEHLEIELVAPVPAADGAGGERELGVGDDALGVEELDDAEAVAARAGAHRVVEREDARFELLQRVRAHRAGEFGREQVLLLRLHLVGDGAAVGVAQRRLERFGEALAHVVAHLEAVDDDVDRVLLRLGELGQLVDLVDLAVHAQARETLRAQFGEQVELFALAVGDDRRKDHQLGFCRQAEHVVDHLRHGLRLQRQLVLGAEGRAGAREEQAQVVVNLGDGADRRARVVAGRLLFDGNRRRQALDQVHVRLLHQLQELPRVGRERLDVAALAFGVQRVESERGFARSGQSRDHDQPVARQVEIDVFEVVRARTADANLVHGVGPGG